MNYSKLSLLFPLIIFSVTTFYAQERIVKVAPGIGTLNQAIADDTPTRTPDTWYVLQNGTATEPSIYLLTSSIENDFELNIRAEGSGDRRPILMPMADNAGVSPRAFRPKKNLRLVGVYVTGINSLGAYSTNTNIIRSGADNVKIYLDNCWLDKDAQSAIRLDNKNCSVFIKNSIISNIGRSIDLDNGRFIDARGVLQDTIWVENTRIYNITSRVYRVGDGGASKVHIWKNNTIVNTGQHCLDVEQVGTFIFKDNLIHNGAFFGRDTVTVGEAEQRTLIELDPIGAALSALGITNQVIDVSHNTISFDPVLLELYQKTNNKDGRTIIDWADSLTLDAVNKSGKFNTIIFEKIDFSNAVQTPINLLTDFLDTTVATSARRPFENPDPTPPDYEFDFTYQQTAKSFTGGSTGKPIGDLTQWIKKGIVSVEKEDSQIPNNFVLMNNYPNPFNPMTNIKYSIPKQSHVTLTIYNSLGQKIATLVNQVQQRGTYTVVWNGSSDIGIKVSSGIYFYQLNADNFVSTKKMILMK